jgi:hypothetical protein
MAELGEAISPPEFLSGIDHDENTCPWHKSGKDSADPMDETDGDDDGAMPKNLGGKLRQKLTAAGAPEPDVRELEVSFKTLDDKLKYQVTKDGKVKNKFQTRFKDSDPRKYPHKYAPHHLVPGNESLKGNPLVAFLGADSVITHFADGVSSVIKDGKSVGYDVNRAENGVWLPSPYAISMGANIWGNEAGLVALEAADGPAAVDLVNRFRAAYVAESIRVTGGRQFHMRHVDYSDLVAKVLEKIAMKLRAMVKGACPLDKKPEADGKINPPMGLIGRLDALSGEMKTLLVGGIWRSPAFTDDLTMTYAETLDKAAATAKVKTVL